MLKKILISLSLLLSFSIALNCAQSADEDLPYNAIIVPSSPQGGEYFSDEEMGINPDDAYATEMILLNDDSIEFATIAPVPTSMNETPLYLDFPPNHPSAKVDASLNSFNKAFRSSRPEYVRSYLKNVGPKQITKENPQNDANLMALETDPMRLDLSSQTQQPIETTTTTTPVFIEATTSVQPNFNPIQAGGHGGAMRNPILNGGNAGSKYASFGPYSRPVVLGGGPIQMDLASAGSFHPAQQFRYIPPFNSIVPPQTLTRPVEFPMPLRIGSVNTPLPSVTPLQPTPPIQTLNSGLGHQVPDQLRKEKKQPRRAKGPPIENNLKPEVEECRNRQRDFFDAMTDESVMADTGLTLAAFNQLSRNVSVYYYNLPIIRHGGNLFFIETLVYIALEKNIKNDSRIFSRYARFFGSESYTCNLKSKVLKIMPIIPIIKNT